MKNDCPEIKIDQTTQKNLLPFLFKDFILSRKSAALSPYTIKYYNNTLNPFLAWLTERSIETPTQIISPVIRAFIAELNDRGLMPSTVHGYARAIKAFLHFLQQERIIDSLPTVDMPKLKRKRQPILDHEATLAVIKTCSIRDRAIIFFLVDSGVRLSELVNITIANVNLNTGLVRVIDGKGGKDRSVAIGFTTIRAIMHYQNTNNYTLKDSAPLFQTYNGDPLTRWGMVQVFKRISKRTKIPFSAHALRRTFAILSLRAGMNPMAVQDLMGHTDMTMTKRYAQMIDDDLLFEHHQHSPVDNLKIKLKPK